MIAVNMTYIYINMIKNKTGLDFFSFKNTVSFCEMS